LTQARDGGCTRPKRAKGNGTAPWTDPACNYTVGGNVG
jgi:hypothetical protein